MQHLDGIEPALAITAGDDLVAEMLEREFKRVADRWIVLDQQDAWHAVESGRDERGGRPLVVVCDTPVTKCDAIVTCLG
jgi:hypothetical protein